MPNKTINDAANVIRQRVNDNDKINYRDEEIVADVATSDFQDAGKLAEYYQEIARTTGRNES